MSSDDDGPEWPLELDEYTLLIAKNHTHVISYHLPFTRILGKVTPPDQAHRRHRLGVKPPFPSKMGDKMLSLQSKSKLRNVKRDFYFNIEAAVRRPGRDEQMNAIAHDAHQFVKKQLYQHQQRVKADFDAKFRAKYAHGSGSYRWPDKRTYDGQWLHGEPHGRGCMTWMLTTGGKEKYDGAFVHGFPHGKGTKQWHDGSRYTGQWVEGKEEGIGTKTYADNSAYRGEWKGGRQNGRGVQTWPDGTTFEGEFNEVDTRGPYATVLQNTFRIFLAKAYARKLRLPRSSPPSLLGLCLDCIAKCVKAKPEKFTADRIKKYVPSHLHDLLAKAFIHQHGEGLSAKFKEIVPVIAWNDDLVDMAFTQARPTIPDLKMLDYFLRSCEKLKTVSLAWNKFTGAPKPQAFEEEPAVSPVHVVQDSTAAGAEKAVLYSEEGQELPFYDTDGDSDSGNSSGGVVSEGERNGRGAESIAILLKANQTITSLDLSWCSLRSSGIQTICFALITNKLLNHLNLAGNKCHKEGAKPVHDLLLTNTTLTSLDLSFNSLGAAGTAEIGKAIEQNSTLHTLNMRYNEMGPSGGKLLVHALMRNPGTLREVVVTDNHLGGGLATEFARILKGSVQKRMALCGFPRSINNRQVRVVEQYQDSARSAIAVRERMYPEDDPAPQFMHDMRHKNDEIAQARKKLQLAKEKMRRKLRGAQR